MKDNAKPLISVIIPTYNRANLVLETINSVLRQSIKDIEILVVDDGSLDNTRQMLEKLNTDGTIRYLWKPNGGVSSARNWGIKNAQGKYIAFLDSDDLFVGESLRQQLEVLASQADIGLVHGDFEKFSSDGSGLGRRSTSWFEGRLYPEILCHWSSLIAAPTVMVPAHVFQEVGYFEPGLTWGEDLDMWWRITRRYEFAHIPKVLARVRVHSGNVSGNRSKEADAFQQILDRAFKADPALPAALRARAQGQMYTLTGLNLLGDYDSTMMPEARRRFGKALQHQPQSWKAYAGWVLSFLPFRLRQQLSRTWRKRQYPMKGNLTE